MSSEALLSQPKIPDNDADRLAALYALKVLDSAPEEDLNEISLIASEICGTKGAFISLVDKDRQWMKSHIGFECHEMPRDLSFCAHAINQSKPMIIEDTFKDDRFKNNPNVTAGLKLRFYAGAQLTTSSGHNIGAICVLDFEPKNLTERQIKALNSLAKQVIAYFERRLLTQQLNERKEFLNKMLSINPDFFSYIDQDYRYQYTNATYKKIFNKEADALHGTLVSDLLGKSAFAAVQPYMEKALKGENQEMQICVPLQVNGSTIIRTSWMHYFPDIRPDGSVAGFFSVIRDISDLKNAEHEAIKKGKELEATLKIASENEKFFRAIFDNSPVGIVQIDKKMNYLSANAAYCEFVGYSEEELKGESIRLVTPSDEWTRSEKLVLELDNTDRTILRFEKKYRHKSGKILNGLVSIRQITLEDGKPTMFCVIEDVTDMRAKEAELELVQSKLIASSKMASLGEMAGGIAHEINNPLAIINLKTDLMRNQIRRGEIDLEKFEAGLNEIKTTGKRIAKIVKGLRQFSRNGDGDQMEKVSFARILDDTLELCKQRFHFHSIDLNIRIDGDDVIECRPTQISQIIMNLLNNSYDAVEGLPEKWISVIAESRGPNFRVRVVDSGKGIPAEIAAKVMEPFFTTKDVGLGTGLGLSISHAMAQAHQGFVSYETKEGHTCFTLELPKAQLQTKLAV